MKLGQFVKLASLPPAERLTLVVEGLEAVGRNVQRRLDELKECTTNGNTGMAALARNVGREEAGKFLVLIDAYRCPGADQRGLARQFNRARDHTAKLIYAQMADYNIATQDELLRLVAIHRPTRYLDGPNDID